MKKFYIALLGRENIINNYKEAKSVILDEIKKYEGVTWETAHEIYQLWYNDILTDKQFDKLIDIAEGKKNQ